MAFKTEIKRAEDKLVSFGCSIQEDRNSLKELKDISKQLKKIISSAEQEIKDTQSIIKKTRKELRKTKRAKQEKENNDILSKIRIQEKELLERYNEKTSGTIVELTNKCQEAQNSINKIQVKEVI